MIKDRNIFVFSDDWGRYPSTLQHIGKILAKYNKIIWVGSLGLRKPRFSIKDLRRINEKLKRIFIFSKSSSNAVVIEFTPFILPFHDFPLVRKINSFLLLAQLKKMIAKHHFTNPILLTSSVIIEPIADKLGATSISYVCLDDFTLFNGAFKCINELEKKLLEKVDCYFAISDKLLDSRLPSKGRSYFLPQGADFEHFNNIASNSVQRLEHISHPIIGFFGLIAPWVNLNLIKSSALAYPDFSFVIIGKNEVKLDLLLDLKNVYYLGEVAYSNLPEYAKEFDVGLIPFEVNDLTISANPLKLLEYFSLGLPVVATDLPEIRKFNNWVLIAKSEKEFVEMIKVAVEKKTVKSQSLERKELAKKYSWNSITEIVSKAILEAEMH